MANPRPCRTSINIFRHIVSPKVWRSIASAFLLYANVTNASALGRTWDFSVVLDDKPIGFHRFTLISDGQQQVLTSDAHFDIRLLLVFNYHYRHHAVERWRDNCLENLDARTDDNGKQFQIAGKSSNHRFVVSANGNIQAIGGCVMSFAYWNPELLKQSHLLNPQTGSFEKIQVASLPDEIIAVAGQQIYARHYRIDGPQHPIELWYSANGDWLQLASTVTGGRHLVYRRNK